MIKLVMRKRGRPIVGLGLSDENVKRLTTGQPIVLNLKELGLSNIDLFIFHGATEADMRGDLIKHGFITEETKERIEGKP